MLYLLQALFLWWLAALALGVVIGFGGRGGDVQRADGWIWPALILFAIGVVAAFLNILPGRYGLWLETALLAVAAYAIGCACGCLVGSQFGASAPPAVVAASAGILEGAQDLPGAAQDAPRETQSPEVSARDIARSAAQLAAAAPSALAALDAAQDILKTAMSVYGATSAKAAVAGQLAAPEPAALATAAARDMLQTAMAASGTAPAAAASAAQPSEHSADQAARSVSARPAAAAAGLVAQEFLKLTAPVAKLPIAGDGLRPPAIDPPNKSEDEDNLLLIRGVDLTLSRALHEIGVWRFSQIAAWSQDHLEWIAHRFRQLSPISAPFWPPQARLLAAGALTDYARAVLRGEAPPREDDANTLAAFVAGLPRPAPGGAGDGLYAGSRPPGFPEPACGERDDLTLVAGIDAERAARLNGLGVWSWRQIARWSPENARWIGAYLATPGAPERENWMGQARAFVARGSQPA